MISETCKCGATFTADAGGWMPSEAHAVKSWRKEHQCPPVHTDAELRARDERIIRAMGGQLLDRYGVAYSVNVDAVIAAAEADQ